MSHGGRMAARMAIVAVAVVAVLGGMSPLALEPAAAHGWCHMDYWNPDDKTADGQQLIIQGRTTCANRHATFTLRMTLKRRVDGEWTRVKRWRKTEEDSRAVYMLRKVDCRRGYYRVHLAGWAGSNHFGTDISEVARIRSCG
jgi:hypothetical protein